MGWIFIPSLFLCFRYRPKIWPSVGKVADCNHTHLFVLCRQHNILCSCQCRITRLRRSIKLWISYLFSIFCSHSSGQREFWHKYQCEFTLVSKYDVLNQGGHFNKNLKTFDIFCIFRLN
jgi:hypothetical protein